MKLDFKEIIGDIPALDIISVERKMATQKTTKTYLSQYSRKTAKQRQ